MKNFDHQSGHYLEVDDAKIYYEDIGDKSLPVLLFLHGGLGNIAHFNGFLTRLPETFRVIGIDSRGHGRSTLGTNPLTYELLQKEVEKVLEHLNIDQLSIIGFSNGGTIGYRLAAFTPLKINHLITIGSPWHTKHVEPMRPFLSTLTTEQWIAQCPSDYASYQKFNPEPNIQKIFPQAIQMALDHSPQGRPNELVKNMNCRLLVVRGEHDPVISSEHILELKTLVKNMNSLTIPTAGHEALLEQPDFCIAALLKFLAEAALE